MNFKNVKCGVLFTFALFMFLLVSNVAEAKDLYVSDNSDGYNIQIHGVLGYEKTLLGNSINLKYDNENMTATFDDALLRNEIENLKNDNNMYVIKSQNSSIIHTKDGFTVNREVYGNEIDSESLHNKVVQAINNNESEIDLSDGCYVLPQITLNSEICKKTMAELNDILNTKITYYFAGQSAVVDRNLIEKALYVDSNFNIYLNDDEIKNFVVSMSNTYNNKIGKSIYVSGGANGNNHSWIIDIDKETATLHDLILKKQSGIRYPQYVQNSLASYFTNVGDTFVELDLSKQYLWFYKNGYIVTQGNLVSGNVSTGCATPTGIYTLNSKQANTKLIGPGYACPVNYWMPFIRNSIGLHDASWRWNFGGEIYKTNGSHGCVNLPNDVAQSLFNNITTGTKIVIHN